MSATPAPPALITVVGRPATSAWLACGQDELKAISWRAGGGHDFLGRLLMAGLGLSKIEVVIQKPGNSDTIRPNHWFRLEQRKQGDGKVWRVAEEKVLEIEKQGTGAARVALDFKEAFKNTPAPVVVAAGHYGAAGSCDAADFAEQLEATPSCCDCSIFVAYTLPKPNAKRDIDTKCGVISVLITDSAVIRNAGWRVREELSLDAQVVDIVDFLEKALPSLLVPKFIVIRLRLDAMLCVKTEMEAGDEKKPGIVKASLTFTHKGNDYLQQREQGTVYGTKSIMATCIVEKVRKAKAVTFEDLVAATEDAMGRCLQLYTWGYPKWKTGWNPGDGKWEEAIWGQTQPLDYLKTRILMAGGEPETAREALIKTLIELERVSHYSLSLDVAALRACQNTWSITRRVLAENAAAAKAAATATMAATQADERMEESKAGVDQAHSLAENIAGKMEDHELFPKLRLRVLQVGALTALERTDVDNICNVQRLLRHYLDDSKWKTPMSLGVFGAPGSGKSFAVKELAKSLKEQFAERIEEFNVAQWTSLADMAAAFHMVRDLRLGGKVPVVFFDEFDADFESRRFGWLKYFLMPMQDGKFQDHDGKHDIGRAVLVFAGGINHRFGEFVSRLRDRDFCDAKGPDFLSRLRGYYDVPSLSLEGDGWGLAKLRRAWILRSKKYVLSAEVRHALLSVEHFRHGARSMIAIMEMSNKNRVTGEIDRSSLPRRDQLGIHVDYEEFTRWMDDYAGK